MPDSRHAYPAGRLEEKRALVCDAETLATLPAILDNGGSWFSGFGTASCAGTRVITLTGDVSHLYTVEVPFGTAIKNVIDHIGGGASGSGIIKTARLGPPFSAFLSQDELASAIDCGSALGGLDTASGVLEVISGGNCGVEMTKQVISFLQGESCGKCVFCREGTLQMSEALKDIAQGDGRPEDLNLMTDLAGAMAEGCLCDLGRNAGRPVVSSIGLFQSDYGAHIEHKRCPKNQ
jgi:NADH-quinone oxidoreductase subunit F